MRFDKKKYLACTVDDLKKTRSYGIEIRINGVSKQYFLIYRDKQVYSYLNRCPHTGVSLDWVPHQFLDSSNSYIQCATHGALFAIENGKCLRGPCVGDQLEIIENSNIEGNIYLII
ncbi:MAG: Rieske 2Fe-2S domain-containing protein [Pseudomonadota bacterium]